MSVVSCNRNFPFRGGSTTLGPSVDVWVPPAWPLARARRVDFLFGPLNLALNCKYVLEVPERMPRPVIWSERDFGVAVVVIVH